MDRSKVIAPCFVFHGWWSGPSPGFLLVLALRLCTRVKPLAGRPGASLSHCRALRKNGDPNSWLFSRPRLVVDEREHGLPLGIHLYLRKTFSLRDSRLVRLLLGAPFPVPSLSCFSLFCEMVISSFLGSRLDSPSRSLTVPLLAPFLLAAGVSPCAAFFPWPWYWLTLLLLSPLFHILNTYRFSLLPHNRHYMPRLTVCFLTVLPVPIPANLTLTATPVDRSLVMRALGGAITSPCSNGPESRRPTLTIFGLSPQLLFNCWMLLDSPIPINGTLWETADRIQCSELACTVATLLQNNMHRILLLALTEGRPPGQRPR